MKYRRLLSISMTIGMLSGCILDSGGNNDTQVVDDNNNVQYGQCSAVDANNQLFEYLQSEYFWYQDLPTDFSPESHDSIIEAMSSIRGSIDKDRFSFAMTSAEYDDYQASIFFGYGFGHMATEDKDGLRIRYVFDEGSAAQNGLRRGDIIREVDGVSMIDILKDVDDGKIQLGDVFGPNEDGYNLDVKFEKPNGTLETAQFSKARITANTVMASQVTTHEFSNESKNVGYLVFNSFDERSASELNTSFDQFAVQGVNELILDLRYNRGGLIRIAQQLTTQVAGSNVEGRTFVNYVHNDKLSKQNRTVEFSLGEGINQLNLDRVVVLTTGQTCSASEMVINALTPFVDVVTIGNMTCGKPVGMYPQPICDHVVFAINFQTQNAAGFGEYFDGLPVDCPVDEEVVGDWGVSGDALYKEGLYYLEHGKCSPTAKGRSAGSRVQRPEIDFSNGIWRDKDRL